MATILNAVQCKDGVFDMSELKARIRDINAGSKHFIAFSPIISWKENDVTVTGMLMISEGPDSVART